MKKRHLHDSLLKVRQNGLNLKSVKKSLGDHKDIVLAAIQKDERALEQAHAIFQNDPDVILEIIKKGKNGIKYAHGDLRKDADLVLMAIKHDIHAFEFADPILKKDEDFILQALKLKGWLLKDCQKFIKINQQMMLTAIKSNGNAMFYASKNFQEDEEMALLASQTGWSFLDNSPFKNHREIVLNAVKNSWRALILASPEMEQDKEIYQEAKKNCLASITSSFSSIENLSPKLRNDPDVFERIIEKTGDYVSDIGEDLKKDKDFIIRIQSKTKQTILDHVSEELKDVTEIVMCDLEKNILQIKFASPRFLDDVDLFMKAIQADLKKDFDSSRYGANWKYGEIWEFIKIAGPTVRDHLEIMKIVVKKNWKALSYASPKLQHNDELFSLALSHFGTIESIDRFRLAGGKLSFKKFAIYQHWQLLISADADIKNDKAFLKEVLTRCIYALAYVPKAIIKDPDFMLWAVKRSWEAIHYASSDLANYHELLREAERQNKNYMISSIPKV